MRATLVTPRIPGAIAIIQIDGDVDAALARLGVAPVAVGERRLCDLCGIDRGVAVRHSETCAQLMPHGGPAVVAGLLAAIESSGIPIGADSIEWPEASDAVEAMALEAIARAASPAALSRLLEQPARWRDWDGVSPAENEVAAHSVILNRLLEAPTIVAVGRPNIGKSALCNALAGRLVALVADEAGVTRDHVGVSLRLGDGAEAVEARWIDTPGMGEAEPSGEIERAAIESGLAALRRADCVALCGDSGAGFMDCDDLPIPGGVPVIRVGLRGDRGVVDGADVVTSALSGKGIGELARLVRESLFPEESMAWAGPWRFDRGLRAD